MTDSGLQPQQPVPGSDNPQTADAGEGHTAPTESQPDAAAGGAPEASSGYGRDGAGISDDQLPEDLQPSDDNPLAQPPSDDDGDAGVNLLGDGGGAGGGDAAAQGGSGH